MVGDPDVTIAILDTGIEWQQEELRTKVHLNAAELPVPQTTGPRRALGFRLPRHPFRRSTVEVPS